MVRLMKVPREFLREEKKFRYTHCKRENPPSESSLSLHHDNFPLGCLYRYDPDGTLSVHEEGGVICSNGIGWSPDETKMYLTDSVRKVFLSFLFLVVTFPALQDGGRLKD